MRDKTQTILDLVMLILTLGVIAYLVMISMIGAGACPVRHHRHRHKPPIAKPAVKPIVKLGSPWIGVYHGSKH